jgi:hypothetical protein
MQSADSCTPHTPPVNRKFTVSGRVQIMMLIMHMLSHYTKQARPVAMNSQQVYSAVVSPNNKMMTHVRPKHVAAMNNECT